MTKKRSQNTSIKFRIDSKPSPNTMLPKIIAYFDLKMILFVNLTFFSTIGTYSPSSHPVDSYQSKLPKLSNTHLAIQTQNEQHQEKQHRP